MKKQELQSIIREEVANALNEAAGQTRDNKQNVAALLGIIKNPKDYGVTLKDVVKELIDILNDNKQFAVDFDNMISNIVDEPLIRGGV